MLRLIHQQTVQGAILVDDIDDGLPNKEVHRLGSTGDPKAYVRDGYANKAKQPCYVSRTKPGDPTRPGYIDLNETEKVTFSYGKGKVSKMLTAGLLRKVDYVASQVATPVLTTADLGTPGPGELTISGTTFLSLDPNDTFVYLTGTGAVTIVCDAAFLLAGGTISGTTIYIPAALIPGVATTTTFAQIKSNDNLSAIVALS